ncbi:hypothetical protein EJB05_16937, partial [Eragrostis curvula]
MSTRKRGGDHGDAALLGAVGLGDFARLGLPDPPDGLDLVAAYDAASGCIAVSVGGAVFSASPSDLAAALALPRGAVGPFAGVGAEFLSSTEAIAAVRRFVRDRVLLGSEEDGGAASEEVAAALRLVEEGKAYEVDWGGLVWAVLKGEVVAGTPRRYAPYLIRLLDYQRPELFSEVDERLPLRKRCKGQTLLQGQWTGEEMGISEEIEVEGGKEDISLDYGASLDIGDLEEMPIFGEGKEAAVADPVDCKRTEQEEIHGVAKVHAELGSQSWSPSDAMLSDNDMECDNGEGIACLNANNQIFAGNSSFSRQLCVRDEQDDSSGYHRLAYGAKSLPASNLQRVIEIEDEDDSDDVGVGLSSAAIRNVPLDISPYPAARHRGTESIYNGQSLPSFNDCVQQILVHALVMKKRYLNKEKEHRQLQAEVQYLKKMVMEKEHVIEATKSDILKDLGAKKTEMYRFEQDKEVMNRTVKHCQKLFKKSVAEFREYKNMMPHRDGVDSYLGVSGINYYQKLACMKQLHEYCLWIQMTWSSKCLELDQMVKEMAKGSANLEHEVKRLKDSISIPDLNNGKPKLYTISTGDDGEAETSPRKSEDIARADEGDHASSSTLSGKQVGELIANPFQIDKTEGSICQLSSGKVL